MTTHSSHHPTSSLPFRRLTQAIGYALAMNALPAAALPFTSVYFFGDSLSDSGQLPDFATGFTTSRTFTNRTGDGQPYITDLNTPLTTAGKGQNVNSGGPVWTQDFTQLLGLDTSLSNPSTTTILGKSRQAAFAQSTGNDYAVGGYRVKDVVDSIANPSNVENAYGISSGPTYMARAGGRADPNALYVLWAGGNDVRDELGSNPITTFYNSLATDQGLDTSKFKSTKDYQDLWLNASDASRTKAQTAASDSISSTALQTAASNVDAAARQLIQQGAVTLAAGGARYMVVLNLPDIGDTPMYRLAGLSGQASALSSSFNAQLDASIRQSHLNIVEIDIFTLLADARSMPQTFGFAGDVSQGTSCFGSVEDAHVGVFCPRINPKYGASTSTPDASKLVFNDGIHPTVATHAIIAQYVNSVITAPAQMSLLAATPLMNAAALNTTDYAISAMGVPHAQTWHSIGGMDGRHQQIDGQDTSANEKDQIQSMYAGIRYDISDHLSVGLVTGADHNKSIWPQGGNYSTNSQYFALFGSSRIGWLQSDATIAKTLLDYSTERDVTLGSAILPEIGATEGRLYSASLSLRANLSHNEQLDIGPVISARSQLLEVDSLSETDDSFVGYNATTMKFEQQRQASHQYAAGIYCTLKQSTRLGNWLLFANAQRLHESHHDAFDVSASLASLTVSNNAANIFKLPGFIPGMTENRGQLGIAVDTSLNLRLAIIGDAAHSEEGHWTTRGISIHLDGQF